MYVWCHGLWWTLYIIKKNIDKQAQRVVTTKTLGCIIVLVVGMATMANFLLSWNSLSLIFAYYEDSGKIWYFLGLKYECSVLVLKDIKNKHNAELQRTPPPANRSIIVCTRCIILQDIRLVKCIIILNLTHLWRLQMTKWKGKTKHRSNCC